jgi:hypothetical protein
VALLEKRRYLNNRSGDFPQVILIVPSHVPNKGVLLGYPIHTISYTLPPLPTAPPQE